MKNILITGGCGFLGYYLVQSIKKQFSGAKIKILDLKLNSVDSYRIKETEIVLGKDITNYDSIKDEFIGIDTVINCAGLVSFSLKDKQYLYDINVNGTKNVLKSSLAHNVKNFVQISSVAALGYKDNDINFVNEDFKFNWENAIKKNKNYMHSKYLADNEVKKYQGRINILILYPGLMFGPGDLKNSAKLIKSIKDKIIPFNLPGGTNIIDVRDVARGIVMALKYNNAGNYLLSGNNIRFSDLNKLIARVVGEKSPSITIPTLLQDIFYFTFLAIEKIKSDIKLTADNIDSGFEFRYFDNSKAWINFQWRPKIHLSKTILDTYKWMVEDGLSK